MERDRFLALLESDGALLLRSAASQDLTAPVPSCPGWDVAEAVRHTASVYEHKLACTALGGPAPDPWPPLFARADDPLGWFADAHARVLKTLHTTDPSARSWTWWDDDQTAGFWVRRMANETAVHRVDVELAAGPPTPVDPHLAVDGIDELLLLMVEGDWTGDEQPDLLGSVTVATAGRTWTVTMAEARVDVTADPAGAEATVTAGESDLLLWLYGRATDDVVAVAGDAAAATRLRRRIAVATQ